MWPETSGKDSAVPEGTVHLGESQGFLSVCRDVKPVGEPDAANPHVRFDEREMETEQGVILGHRQPKGPGTRKASLNDRATSRLYFFAQTVFPLWE
jgi:hypothetical protein